MVYYRDMKTGAVFQYKETWKPYLYWMRVPRREFREYVKTHNAAKAKGKVAFSEFMSELFKTVGIGEYFET